MFEKYENKINEKLSEYSTMKVGGLAKQIVFPQNFLEVKEILKIGDKSKVKLFVLGNGSNILFDDEGFDGVIVSLKNLKKIKKYCDGVFVEAGVNLFVLNTQLMRWGLGGLEWSYGIPASFGGFVFMNGGCFGHEICEFIEYVIVLKNGKICRLWKEDIVFSYRKTSLSDCVILGAKLKLVKKESKKIESDMQFFYNKKKESQPCDLPSLGSIFKRSVVGDTTIFPAKIIDEMGLKGKQVGGAQISKKHSGFIVNVGGATSKDIKELISFVEDKFLSKGLRIEREIVILGK